MIRVWTGRGALALLLLGGIVLASFDIITVAQYLPYAIVGGVLVVRRPRNPIAWLLIAIGSAFLDAVRRVAEETVEPTVATVWWPDHRAAT